MFAEEGPEGAEARNSVYVDFYDRSSLHIRRIRGRALPSGRAPLVSRLGEKKKKMRTVRGASRNDLARKGGESLGPRVAARCFTLIHYTSLRQPSAGRSAIHETPRERTL